MDIAKIRKKLKETKESQQSEVNDQKVEDSKKVKPEEKTPEPEKAEDKTEGKEVPHTEAEEKKPELTETSAGFTQEAEITEEKEIREEPVKAKAEIEEEMPDDIVELVLFSLLKEDFAFEISQVAEILRYQRITMVPKTPNYVVGLTSLRGKVIPVIDLKVRLSLTDKLPNIDQKCKILIIKGTKGPIGIIVDKVVGVARIAKTEVKPPPAHLTEAELKFIGGVAVIGNRFTSIINMEEAVAISL
ncbi:MAG: chemotaxis protein CheW [Nitrospirota bacterium]